MKYLEETVTTLDMTYETNDTKMEENDIGDNEETQNTKHGDNLV